MLLTFRLFLGGASLIILALAVIARGLIPMPELRTRVGEVPSLGRSLIQEAMIPRAFIKVSDGPTGKRVGTRFPVGPSDTLINARGIIASWIRDRPRLGTSPTRVRSSGIGMRPRAMTAKARIIRLAPPRNSRKVRSIFVPALSNYNRPTSGMLEPEATPDTRTGYF